MQEQYQLLKDKDTTQKCSGEAGSDGPPSSQTSQLGRTGPEKVFSSLDEPPSKAGGVSEHESETAKDTKTIVSAIEDQMKQSSDINDVGDTTKTKNKPLEDMECYLKFVNEEIISKHRMHEEDSKKPPKMRFTDLWSLFRSGELIYERSNSTESSEDEDTNSPQESSKGPESGGYSLYTTMSPAGRSTTSIRRNPESCAGKWQWNPNPSKYMHTTSTTMENPTLQCQDHGTSTTTPGRRRLLSCQSIPHGLQRIPNKRLSSFRKGGNGSKTLCLANIHPNLSGLVGDY